MRHPSGAPDVCVNCSHDLDAGAIGTAGAGSLPGQHGIAAAAPTLANGGLETASEDEDAPQQAGGVVHPGILQPPPPLRSRLRAELVMAGASGAPRHAEEAGSVAEEPSSQLSSLRDAIRTGGAAGQPQRAQRAQPPPDQGQEASAAIAGLMLQGWAMLEQHCPRWAPGWLWDFSWRPACCPGMSTQCMTCLGAPPRRCLNPLLRSRNRSRTFCAGCRMDVVQHGEQASHAPHASPAQLGRALPTEQSGKEADQPAAPGAAGSSAAYASEAPASVAAAQAIVSPALPPVPRGPSLPQHVPDVDRAAAVVAARLTAAAADLAVAQPGGGALLLAEVQQCAAALGSLAECRRSLTGLA